MPLQYVPLGLVVVVLLVIARSLRIAAEWQRAVILQFPASTR